MSTPRLPRFARAAPVLVAALAAAFAVHRIEDFDTWYHLAAGLLMLATWRWPAVNTFSSTAPDYPWVDLHWIFQLLLYGAWSLAGPTGVILLAATLIAATSLVLYGVARPFVPPALAAFLTAVALAISSARFVPRPELLSFLYFAVYLAILERYPRDRGAIWWLVPLQVVWVNTQGIFAVGLALIGCWWLGATLAFLPLPRGWKEANALSFEDWRRLTVVLVLATLGCFLNPWGTEGAFFPFQLLPRVTGNSLFSNRIGEFRPPLQSGYAPPLMYTWVALLVVCGLTFLLNARRWRLGFLFAALAFGFLSTQSLRNVAFFGWVAVPAIAVNLGPLLARRRWPDRLGAALASTALAGIVLLIGAVVTNQLSYVLEIQREFGLGVSPARFPEAAVDFIERTGITGRAFNCLAMGGYLTWRRPDDAVFVDGRLEAFPEDVFRGYFAVMDDPATWPRFATPYRLDYALLYHAWSNRLPLVRYLAQDHGWSLVYYDEIASVFVPDDDAHREVRERAQSAFAEIRKARGAAADPPVPTALERAVSVPVSETWRQRSYGNFLRQIGAPPAEAVRAFQRALALDPDQLDARFSLGFAYWDSGRHEDAIREWREVLRRDPTNAQVKQVLLRAGSGAAR